MDNQLKDEEVKPFQTSLLFERFSVWIIISILTAAIWYRMLPIIILAIFLLIVNGVIWLWKSKALVRVLPSVKLSRDRIFAGDSIKMNANLVNDKWLPLAWIEWVQNSQPFLSWEGKADMPYQIRFLWLMGFQEISWDLELKVQRRGVYRVGEIALRSGDAFRFTEEEKKWSLPSTTIYVYPSLVPVKPPSFPSTIQWKMAENRGGLLEDPLLVKGMREYQNGDDWRRIDWKASARTGTLQTRLYENVRLKELVFYIDVRGYDLVTRTEDFEWFLSVIASTATAYHQQGIKLGWATNAVDHEGHPIPLSLPTATLTPFMDTLAKMSARVGESGLLWDDSRYPVLCFCDQVSKHYKQWELEKNRAFAAIYFYMKESADVPILKGSAKRMESLLSIGQAKETI